MAHKILDVKGLCCPMPIIRAQKALETLAVGDTMEVHATDPGSRADFPAWIEIVGQELLSAEEVDGVFIYRMRKVR